MKIGNGLKTGITAGVCVALSLMTPIWAEPGSQDDPLISQSYINSTVIPQLREYIKEEVDNRTGAEAQRFKVVSMSAGDKMICEDGTELILRMGSATIIATEKGGLADTTAGCDLPNGTPMPSNHLLIVPLSDGRGIVATSEVLVMVKGIYEIQK